MKSATPNLIWTDDELMGLDSKDGRRDEPNKFELIGERRFLTGNSLLPGFRFAIARLFDDPAFS